MPSTRAAPLPPPRTVISTGGTTPWILVGAIALFAVGLYFGVQKLRNWGQATMDDVATRPYQAPNRLVIAAVRSDYGSSATDDGALVLRKEPRGPAAGLAGFFRVDPLQTSGAVEKAISMIPGATYRALEATSDKCRSDADTSESTLGEITIEKKKITVFTCALTKKNHQYFLAWASADPKTDRAQLERMLKSSQLVSNDLCAVNVINGGCRPAPDALVKTLVQAALR